MNWRFHSGFAVLATALVAFAVAWGFMLVGSPGTRRLERLDRERLQDLQTIVREIEDLSVETDPKRVLKAPLPKTLEDVAKAARSQRIRLVDPETGTPYRYRVVNESSIELCATFAQSRDSDSAVFWNHPAGAHCFTIDVLDPPPYY